MRPKIGLIPLYDDQRESYWMLPGYMKMLEGSGGLPVMLPLTEDPEELSECLSLCDGLLLTGGHDVDPKLYKRSRHPQCGRTCPARDQMEQWLIQHALLCDKPLFGICRGIQLLNAVLGGTLYQDLNTDHPSAIDHCMAPPYNRPAHPVEILPDTPLAQIVRQEQLGVNSYHHQAIQTLAPALRPMAQSPDGLVEAVYMPTQTFVMAVQWHPEFFYPGDAASDAVIGAFVDACAAYQNKEGH